MEGGRKPAGSSSSSSSISSDLFGAKSSANSSSSTGIFDSVFPHPSSIAGSGYSRNEVVVGSRRKQDSEHQPWSTKHGDSSKNSESWSHNKGIRNSIFQDERAEPCYFSSSLYYGGQDVYSNPSSRGNTTASPHIFKKDADADDPNGSNLDSASRGNWWQGSLYY